MENRNLIKHKCISFIEENDKYQLFLYSKFSTLKTRQGVLFHGVALSYLQEMFSRANL
jgi:hypothetical protein